MAELRPLEPADPQRLGGYLLLGRLGSGGQGTVFLGEDGSGRRVAVKLLQAVEDPEARTLFVRELAVAKQVSAFCTAQVIDADVAGDRPYIVSEFIEGPTLQALVEAEGPRTRGALERLAIGTVTALTAIHRAGVVHRDFKPSNVVLGADGPRVIDFGIAKALDVTSATASRVIGTPSYMAPEQLQGVAVGPSADVFAWGITIVFAATGRPAFGSDTIPAVMQRILHEEADLQELTGPLREVVASALTKEPLQRPTAQQLLLRLVGTEASDPGWIPERLTTDANSSGPGIVPEPNSPPSPPPQTLVNPAGTEQGRRSRQVLALSGLAALLAVALVAVAVVPRLTGSTGTTAPSSNPATNTVTITAPTDRQSRTAATAPNQTAANNPTRPADQPSGPAGGIPPAFSGTWTGTATNQAGVTFPLTATFQPGDTSARISYAPPAHCDTTATLTASSAQLITLSVPSSTGCTPGIVTVILSGTGLNWNFRSNSNKYSIQAFLTRN